MSIGIALNRVNMYGDVRGEVLDQQNWLRLPEEANEDFVYLGLGVISALDH